MSLVSNKRALPNRKPLSLRGRLVLVVLWTLFIWSRSLFAGPESSAQSNFVVALIKPLFIGVGITDVSLISFIVRKTAHFTEYTILGILLALTCPDVEDCHHKIVWQAILWGVAVPSIDETVQLFVPERSGQVSDVLLDCAGVAFGMLLVKLIGCHQKRA